MKILRVGMLHHIRIDTAMDQNEEIFLPDSDTLRVVRELRAPSTLD